MRGRMELAEAKEAQATAALDQAQARHDQAVAHTAAVQPELEAVGAEAAEVPQRASCVEAGLKQLLA